MWRRIKEWSSKSKEADPQSTSSHRGRYIHDQIILDLARQKIGARQGKQIAKELATNTSLWSLDLSANHMGDRVVVAIADALKTNNSLRTLKLCFNDIGDVGMKALGESLTLNNSLTELHLSGNEIGTAGMTSLADGLKVNSGLKTLWLSYCSIDDNGLTILADALRSNTRLTELLLLSNQFGDEGTKSMLDVLFMYNTTLTRLYLDMNAVSSRKSPSPTATAREPLFTPSGAAQSLFQTGQILQRPPGNTARQASLEEPEPPVSNFATILNGRDASWITPLIFLSELEFRRVCGAWIGQNTLMDTSSCCR
jgi:Leucine Rich repeat